MSVGWLIHPDRADATAELIGASIRADRWSDYSDAIKALQDGFAVLITGESVEACRVAAEAIKLAARRHGGFA